MALVLAMFFSLLVSSSVRLFSCAMPPSAPEFNLGDLSRFEIGQFPVRQLLSFQQVANLSYMVDYWPFCESLMYHAGLAHGGLFKFVVRIVVSGESSTLGYVEVDEDFRLVSNPTELDANPNTVDGLQARGPEDPRIAVDPHGHLISTFHQPHLFHAPNGKSCLLRPQFMMNLTTGKVFMVSDPDVYRRVLGLPDACERSRLQAMIDKGAVLLSWSSCRILCSCALLDWIAEWTMG